MRWRGTVAARALAALGLAAGAASCANAPGELVLAVQTDVALPKDIDTIRIEVSVAGVQRFMEDYEQLGLPGSLLLPATLGLVQPEDDPTAPVTIRVSARRSGEVRILREVVTQVPDDRVATLRVPLHFLCDGSAEPALVENHPVSRCEPGFTCVAGVCERSDVDSATLLDYNALDIFGGGTVQGDGECLDVGTCFGTVTDAPYDADCTIEAPAGAFNVALVTEQAGMCNESGCFVALDADSPEGFTLTPSGRVQLPKAVCNPDPRFSSTSTGVVTAPVTDACPRKTVNIPTCGPWSAVGPGATPTAASPTAVVTSSAQLSAVRIVGAEIYWAGSGVLEDPQMTPEKAIPPAFVKAAALEGGVARTVLTKDTKDPISLRYLTIAGGDLYWTEANRPAKTGAIMKVGLNGSAPQEIQSIAMGQPEGIAVGGGFVFWTDFGVNTVTRRALDGSGQDLVLVQHPRPFRIVAEGDLACWTNEGDLMGESGSVWCLPQGAGQAIQVVSMEATPRAIALRDSTVYWATFEDGGHVTAAHWNGAGFDPPRDLATSQSYPNGIAVDAESVYWTTRGGGEVLMLPKDAAPDTPPSVLATGQRAPGEILVQDGELFWINEAALGQTGSAVMRLKLQ